MTFVNDPQNSLTIDRDNKISIHKTGRNREGASFFDMVWKDSKFEFVAEQEIIKDKKGWNIFKNRNATYSVKWVIISMSIPTELKEVRETIIDKIIEALTVFCVNYGGEKVSSIEVSLASGIKKK